MALKTVEIKNGQNKIPLLDIGDVPIKNVLGQVTHSGGDTLVERGLRWQIVFEAQLRVDWNATTIVSKKEGKLGQSLLRTRTQFQDIDNFITEPPTRAEQEETRQNLLKTSPGMKQEYIDKILQAGKVVGVKFKKKYKGGRENRRIFVYRYIPEKIFEDLGYRSNLPPGLLMMPYQLMYSRKDIRAFRDRIIRQYGKRAGEERICYFCHEPFISRKKQEEPYICTKHRCRKAKVRLKNIG
jgi:hypothetical protein